MRTLERVRLKTDGHRNNPAVPDNGGSRSTATLPHFGLWLALVASGALALRLLIVYQARNDYLGGGDGYTYSGRQTSTLPANGSSLRSPDRPTPFILRVGHLFSPFGPGSAVIAGCRNRCWRAVSAQPPWP